MMRFGRFVRVVGLLLLLCQPAVAQSPYLNDDHSVRMDQITIRKPARGQGGDAELTLDVDLRYRAVLLYGEPLIYCSAVVSNLRGEIAFQYRGKRHTVRVGPETQDLVSVLALEFDVIHRFGATARDQRSYFTTCDAGVPKSWRHDAFSVATVPAWDNFACEVPEGGWRAPPHHPDELFNRAMPSRAVGKARCARGGVEQGEPLSGSEARQLFAREDRTQMVFTLASAKFNFNDLLSTAYLQADQQAWAEHRQNALRQIRQMTGNAAAPALVAIRDRVDQALQESTRPGSDGVQRLTVAWDDITRRSGQAGASPEMRRIAGFIRDSVTSPEEKSLKRLIRLRQIQVRLLRDRTLIENLRGYVIQDIQGWGRSSPQLDLAANRISFNTREIVEGRCPGPRGDQPPGISYFDTAGECDAGPYAEGSEFSEGFAVIRRRDADVYEFIDYWGIRFFGEHSRAEPFSHGRARVERRPGEKGYIDRRGHFYGPYAETTPFTGAIAAVAVSKDGKRRWGVINRFGEVLAPMKYDSANVITSADGRRTFARLMGDTQLETGSCYDTTYYTVLEIDEEGQILRGPETVAERGRSKC